MVEKKLFELGLNGLKEKKNVRIGSDFLIGLNGPREIWCGQWAGSKKMDQYRCVINITWLSLMKHAMLVKKGQTKVKKTIGSCFNSIDKGEKLSGYYWFWKFCGIKNNCN